jgi:hypothetical protein
LVQEEIQEEISHEVLIHWIMMPSRHVVIMEFFHRNLMPSWQLAIQALCHWGPHQSRLLIRLLLESKF